MSLAKLAASIGGTKSSTKYPPSRVGRRGLTCLVVLFSLVLGDPQPLAAQNQGKVRGTVEYEKIPYRDEETKTPGLQPKKSKFLPVIGAKVELLTAAGAVLGAADTDANGGYTIPWTVDKETAVTVRVSAVSKHVVITDFGKPTLHTVSSGPVTIFKDDVKQDIKATDEGKHAGAFNILEAIRLADAVLEKAEPGIAQTIPKITVQWTAGVYPNGTSRFSGHGNMAFIKGNRDFTPPSKLSGSLKKEFPRGIEGDCDEFDDYVIIHEYGHFLMRNFSREDSPGGLHGAPGEKLDPHLAWSEGWANFFACAVLDNPNYVDTDRDEKGNEVSRVTFNLDDNFREKFVETSYWSEHTVGSTLWDLFDKRPARHNDVHLGLGFKPIWEIVPRPAQRLPARHAHRFLRLFGAGQSGTGQARHRRAPGAQHQI